MRVNVVAQQFTLTPAIGAWVHQQIATHLNRFDREIGGLDVHLSDAHGPGGGRGVSAAVTVFLRHRAPVHITTVHADAFSAIAISAQRCDRAVQQALRKRRQIRRLEQPQWPHAEAGAA